jgi:uncharacterized protein
MNLPSASPRMAHPALRYESERDALPGEWSLAMGSASMLDGFLCGVLLQPRPVAEARWWAAWVDAAVAGLPDDAAAGDPTASARRSAAQRHSGAERNAHAPDHPVQRLRALACARHTELSAAINERRWFDPWVFDLAEGTASNDARDEDLDRADGGDDRLDDALNDAADDAAEDIADDAGMPGSVHETMYLWAAGFIEAMACFDDLLELTTPAAAEPQALICQFLDRDELENADALWDLVDSFEPPQTLTDAVECVVRATLLLADITRPRNDRAERPGAGPRSPRRPGPPFNRGGSRRS